VTRAWPPRRGMNSRHGLLCVLVTALGALSCTADPIPIHSPDGAADARMEVACSSAGGAPKANGQPCGCPADCGSGFCVDGSATAPLAPRRARRARRATRPAGPVRRATSLAAPGPAAPSRPPPQIRTGAASPLRPAASPAPATAGAGVRTPPRRPPAGKSRARARPTRRPASATAPARAVRSR
jgi:hypothetical protein